MSLDHRPRESAEDQYLLAFEDSEQTEAGHACGGEQESQAGCLNATQKPRQFVARESAAHQKKTASRLHIECDVLRFTDALDFGRWSPLRSNS
jgi:hypothetical protein